MRYCPATIFAVTACVVNVSFAYGDDAKGATFETILAGASEQRADDLWSDVLQSDFELSSKVASRKGFFECSVAAVDDHGKPLVRHWQFDDDGQRRVSFQFGKVAFVKGEAGDSGAICIDGQWLVMEEPGQWTLRPLEGWVHAVDDTHPAIYWERPDLLERGKGVVEFRLGPYLRGTSATRSNLISTSWHAPTYTLSAQRASGLRTIVRFRSPNDQRRFGTLLSEVSEQTSSGDVFWHRSFIIDRESPLRLKVADAEALADRLDAVRPEDGAGRVNILKVTTQEQRAGAAKLIKEVGTMPSIDYRSKKYSTTSSTFHERLNGYIEVYRKDVAPSIRNGRRYEGIEDLTDGIVVELEIAYLSIIKTIAGGDDRLIDDPNLLRVGLERTLPPQTTGPLFDGLSADILSSNLAPLSAKVNLSVALAELGPSVWVVRPPLVAEDEKRFLEAIFHARWKWVPREDEIQICQEMLASEWAGGEAKSAAIDSLVRWGRFDLVPPKPLDLWFEARLEESEALRHCMLKALSLSLEGRALMRSKIAELQARPNRQKELIHVLRTRIEATRELQRYDFMTEAECQETLRLCENAGR